MPTLSLKKLILICALVTLTGIAILLALFLIEDAVIMIALMALILLCWPVGILINHFRKNRQPKAEAELGTEAPKPIGTVAPAREYEELSRGAEEAVQFLRSSNLGNREVSDAIYGLPWYVLAGPPNSGKTSLALSAGLTFNALSSQRRADQNLVRATRDCEWRVTDNGVLIDTAGRYVTEGPDRDEWLGLIDTLKKTRKNRALDGFVLTVNAAHLLNAKEAELEQQAQVLRARLDEVIKSSGVRFPVYLVFTHADAVPGFNEFFAALPPVERAQVWGATIPLEQSQNAHALFDVEFDYLLDALMKRRLLRLSAATTPAEQYGTFNFPLQFAETRRKLGLFTLALFRPNPFSELPLLRGFYFTSNPLGPDGRIHDAGTFSEDLFKQVIFRDKDIAASFQSQKAAPNKLAKVKLGVAALAAVCLLWAGGSVVSFFNNNGLLAEAQEHAKRVLDHYEAGRGKDKVETTPNEMDNLDKLRTTLQKIDDADNNFFGSLASRFGLYSGDKIRTRTRQVYFDFVSQRFLAPAITGLEAELKTVTPPTGGEGAEEKLDEYYHKLAAYLMMEKQERMDAKFLETRLSPYWPEKADAQGKQENLAFFTEQAASHDDDDPTVPRLLAQAPLVKEAQDKLKTYTATKRVYNAVIRKINNQGEAIDLVKLLAGTDVLLTETNPHPVPYAYTKQAYFKLMTGSTIAEVMSELKDDWVMGGNSATDNVNPEDLKKQYSQDFVTHWQKFLSGIHVSKFADVSQAVEALGKLSQANSSLLKAITEINTETNLAIPPKDDGLVAWIKGFVLTKAGLRDPTVEAAFVPLHKFATSQSLETYRIKLGEVQEKLRGFSGKSWTEVASAQNKEWEKPVGDIVSALSSLDAGSGSKAAANILKSPLDDLVKKEKEGKDANLTAAWAKLVQSAKQLESRYPFSNSESEVQPSDFAQFFNPVDGQVKKLMADFLTGLVQGQPGQLTTTDPTAFSLKAVEYLNRVHKLQQAFFAGGQQQLRVAYTLAIKPPPNKKVVITVDGPPITVEGSEGKYQLVWPASGGEAGVRVQLLDNVQAQAVGQTASPSPQANEVAKHAGPWGLFRMAAGKPPQFNWNGVSAKLEPPVNNPFTINFAEIRVPPDFK